MSTQQADGVMSKQEQFLLQSEAEIIRWIDEHPDQKFDDDTVEPYWGDFIRKWVEDYQGDFSYLLGMKDQFSKPNSWPSRPQIRGVANCYRAELLRTRRQQKQKTPNAAVDFSRPEQVTPVLKPGRYTVVLDGDSSDRVTIRIEDGKEGFIQKARLPLGTQIASYMWGPSNDFDFKGFSFVIGNRASPWSDYRDNERLIRALTYLVTGTDEQQQEAGQTFALESGQCYRCGKALTVPVSIGRGLGPQCYSKVYGSNLDGEWED